MISCHIHDYIEIACLYGYDVKLSLGSDECIEGKAMTTRTTPDKREWLVIAQGQQEVEIEMDQITSMQALTQNPHFSVVNF